MKLRRRRLTGTPLLVATAGAALSVTGCSGIGPTTSGNLVAPPMHELCVDVTPADAAVTVDGVELDDEGCTTAYEGTHEVAAEADGYQDYLADVEVYEDTTHVVELTPE